MIKAVFFDIDGTLISFKTHKIPQSTINAINELKNKGIKVFIATGRSLPNIKGFDNLEFDGFITANGAYCVDASRNVIFQNLIPKSNLDTLAEYLEKQPLSCAAMTDQGDFINYVDETTMSLYNIVDIPIPTICPLKECFEYNVYQLDIFMTEEQEKPIMDEILTDCESARWFPSFTDVNVKNNNKGTGIDKFIERFGIKLEETMAFGDGGNDIQMLQHAGIGVAMGNANDNVKAIADYVTSSVDEDGIVNALKHFNVL